MNKHVALVSYFALWAAIAAGIVYGIVGAGYSVWRAAAVVYLLFFFLNGSMAYWARSRLLRREGREPPPYLQYLLFPNGAPKPKEEAPKLIQIIVGVVATLGGVFFVGCGGALFLDTDYSRINHPEVAAIIEIVLVGIGVALFYVGWRCIAPGNRPPNKGAELD